MSTKPERLGAEGLAETAKDTIERNPLEEAAAALIRRAIREAEAALRGEMQELKRQLAICRKERDRR